MKKSDPVLGRDELESAKILIQEDLLEEAKKTLFRLLTKIQHQTAEYGRAKEMLLQIEEMELEKIINQPTRLKSLKIDDVTKVIEQLDGDLRLDAFSNEVDVNSEMWSVQRIEEGTVQEHLDLGVAFFEMGCFYDAIRELTKAEKKIRIESTFLGEKGVSVVALLAQARLRAGHAFQAKLYLEPILLEDDIHHEQKIILYYTMGLVEQALGENMAAKGWFQKVQAEDPLFKDVQQRIQFLMQTG